MQGIIAKSQRMTAENISLADALPSLSLGMVTAVLVTVVQGSHGHVMVLSCSMLL